MPSLSLPDRLIWFAHCPKTGGTSIEQVMVATWGSAVGHLHWGWDRWWRSGGWRVADPPNSPQHLIWQDAIVQLPRVPNAIFAVVRDPVARLSSEYRWQRRGRRGTRAGTLLAWLPFPLWLRLMLAVARRAPHAFDNHLRPQADFVPHTATVFRLEDGLEPVADWLAAATGCPLPAVALPHAIPTGQAALVRASDAARIGAAFAVDYARFGYIPPDGRVPSRDVLDWVADRLAIPVAALDRRGRL